MQGLCLCWCLWLDGCCGTAETLMASRLRRNWDTLAALSTGWLATSAAKSEHTGAKAELPERQPDFVLKVEMPLFVRVNIKLQKLNYTVNIFVTSTTVKHCRVLQTFQKYFSYKCASAVLLRICYNNVCIS